MSTQAQRIPRAAVDAQVIAQIVRLASAASVEVNVQDAKHLADSRNVLAAGTRVYVSHLPGQTWDATRDMCMAVRANGFEPVPHVPVRLVESQQAFDRILGELASSSRPRELLLIAGDYPGTAGPYDAVAQALESGALERHEFSKVSVAGHPEGHPRVDAAEIRRSEDEKPRIAARHGLTARFVTQFLFEPEPFVDWAGALRAQGIEAELICGLAGPAKITTLFRYAMRCGVGPSIRALGARPSSVMGLIGDHGPERMLRHLAEAHVSGRCRVDGVHLFGFGGYLRTARWIRNVASGSIRLQDHGGFET
jgi:methylenetetrahydrofolate reductase (NADH)